MGRFINILNKNRRGLTLSAIAILFLSGLFSVYGADTISVQNPAFYPDISNRSQIKVEVTAYDHVNTLGIKYGLITTSGKLIYSSQLPLSKFDIKFIDTNAEDWNGLVRPAVKFSIGTYIPAGYSGFFYEFMNLTATNTAYPNKLEYWPEYKTFFNNRKYHISIKDLYDHYQIIKIEGSKVLIYTMAGFYNEFDPVMEEDGVPTDPCMMGLTASYNTTLVRVSAVLNMGCKASWSGKCTTKNMTWQSNQTSATWRIIPPSGTFRITCNGASCSKASPSNGVWYYKLPKCNNKGYAWLRCNLTYIDHNSNSVQTQTAKQKIECYEFCCGDGETWGWQNLNCSGMIPIYGGSSIGGNTACPTTTTSTTTTTTTTTTIPKQLNIKATWVLPKWRIFHWWFQKP
jgi:hypothetical protein